MVFTSDSLLQSESPPESDPAQAMTPSVMSVSVARGSLRKTLLIVLWQICDGECQALQVKLYKLSLEIECQDVSVSAPGLRATDVCVSVTNKQTFFLYGVQLCFFFVVVCKACQVVFSPLMCGWCTVVSSDNVDCTFLNMIYLFFLSQGALERPSRLIGMVMHRDVTIFSSTRLISTTLPDIKILETGQKLSNLTWVYLICKRVVVR